MKAIAAEHGTPLKALIPRVIEEEGSVFGAALKLGVTPNTIQYWLKANKLTVKTRQIAEVVPTEDNDTVEVGHA